MYNSLVWLQHLTTKNFLIHTGVNSKSFWLVKLRMYSSRNWFSGQANWTGGTKLFIAVTIVWRKNRVFIWLKHIFKYRISYSTCELINVPWGSTLTSIASFILFLISWIFCFFSLWNKQTVSDQQCIHNTHFQIKQFFLLPLFIIIQSICMQKWELLFAVHEIQ